MKRLRTLGLAALIGLGGCAQSLDDPDRDTSRDFTDSGRVEVLTQQMGAEYISYGFRLDSGNCYFFSGSSIGGYSGKVSSYTNLQFAHENDFYVEIRGVYDLDNDADSTCNELERLEVKVD